MTIAGQINEVNDLSAELHEAENLSAELNAVPGETGGAVSDERIAAVVEAYMAENPVTESDPTVPAWAKNPTKPSYTAEDVGALSADSLPAAVNEALAQAKASGEFDGKDGSNGKDGVPATHSWNNTILTITSASGTSSANLKGEKGDKGDKGDSIKGDKGDTGAAGTSVTVKSVSESTADGGSNVVTFSDGKTVTIKNGSKGSTGATGATGSKGADGKTPVKGVDYFTEADKVEMVNAVIAALPVYNGEVV